ncbi:MAG: DivIVA domain-containing protein [Persicimonas sp.]
MSSIKFSADDIASQTFERRFRGYDPDQVEEFLEVLSRDYEHLVARLEQAEQKLREQREELRDYRKRERSLHEAINTAREMGDEIKEQAERDAEHIVAQAEIKAEKMLSGVENRVAALREELFELQQQRLRCETEVRNVLESHMKMLDLLSAPEPDAQSSSISRAPSPPAPVDDVENEREDDDSDEVVDVADEDIESEEPIEEVASTSPGMAAT